MQVKHWINPFSPNVVEDIERAAAACSGASRSGKTFTYRLVPTRSVSLLRPWNSLSGRVASLRRFKHGRTMKLHLPFRSGSGVLGPYARADKQAQRPRKENGLLFLQDDTGAKSVLNVSLGVGNLAREIHLLKMLAGTGIVPKVIMNDPSLRWVQLEFVESETLDRDQQAERYLSKIAPIQFDAFGTKLVPAMGGLRQLDISIEQFLETAERLAISEADTFLNEKVTASLIHEYGLCSEVMINTRDERIMLLDWEAAKLGPVAFDIVQAAIFQREPGLRFMRRIVDNDAAAMSAERQLLFALICVESRDPQIGAKISITKKQPSFEERKRLLAALV